MKYKLFVISMAILLIGCTSPRTKVPDGMTEYDEHSSYSYSISKDQIRIDVLYERYQFIQDSAYLTNECKDALREIMGKTAKTLGLRVQQPSDQNINSSIGRNGFTGITTCSANANVKITGIDR